MPQGGVRLFLAPDDDLMTESPTWVQVASGRIAEIDIQRGRSDELNRTGPGSARVKLNDTAGEFDPTRDAVSDWFATRDTVAARIDLWNPVAESWQTVFRGFTNDRTTDVPGSAVVLRHEIPLVDGFDYLARAEAAPYPAAGDLPFKNSVGQVCYEAADVDVRIAQHLGDAGWPSGLTAIFTGNVVVKDTVYAPGTAFLAMIQDAADAEFPDVSNTYISRGGVFHFHGRFAKFDPIGTAASASGWTFNDWRLGDELAIINGDADVQIRPPLSYADPLTYIYNAAQSYPKGMRPELAKDLAKFDLASIAKNGVRPWQSPELIVLKAQTGTRTGADECASFNQYIIDNYADARIRVNALTVKTIAHYDYRAELTWLCLTEIDIGDRITLTTHNPGGGGFSADQHYVEGVSYNVRPLNGDYAMITLTINCSPATYYNTEFT